MYTVHRITAYITRNYSPLSSVPPQRHSPSRIKMLNVETDLFQAYAFYTAIVVFKMMIMSFLTARQRFKTMTFISSEDAKQPGSKV